MFGKVVNRRSSPEVFLRKGVLEIYSKFTGEHPYHSVISMNLQIETTLQHRCSPVNLLHIFRTPFPKNTSGGMLLSKRFGSEYKKGVSHT